MWYVLQLGIIIWIIYLYTVVIPNPASSGQIILFAVLVAYVFTWLLSRAFWLLRYGWRYVRRDVVGVKRDSNARRG